MFRSLRFRMAVSHGLVLAVILVVLGGIGQALLARSLDHNVTTSLRDAAAEEADHIRETGSLQAPADSDVPERRHAVGLQVEAVAGAQGAHVGFLHEVFGAGGVARQAPGDAVEQVELLQRQVVELVRCRFHGR